MNINKFIKEYSSNKPLKSPTPNCKLYNSNRFKTIFYTLADAITEGKKWETEDALFPTIHMNLMVIIGSMDMESMLIRTDTIMMLKNLIHENILLRRMV